MALNINDPGTRRADLIAAMKVLMQPEWDDAEGDAALVQAIFNALVGGVPAVIADAAWSPALADRGLEKHFTAACVITFPNDPTFPVGWNIPLSRLGAGEVTVAAAAGATLKTHPVGTRLPGDGALVLARVIGNDGTNLVWHVQGDLS
ncbi:hypothetical protein KHC23_08650 [Ancylobacter dichloromethanicus]|uniref:Uncharacterized protein n=1 Tax=Ancylobacter dichloromethanicus TaxID=518825 RepID=A0A9W6N1Y4_9HYPH|nr:hypothetical protein [Ancylobacter dichloromethanicus]MBS7553718.1 hypothetical protein [Ancylobacter dichloromethanicus]GLK74681.1 hypothetical protein GCM10017643_48000 [Ancylobacter dichloromethanicus]